MFVPIINQSVLALQQLEANIGANAIIIQCMPIGLNLLMMDQLLITKQTNDNICSCEVILKYFICNYFCWSSSYLKVAKVKQINEWLKKSTVRK